MITITLLGDPIAQMRPRFSRRGGFMRTYDPQSSEKEKIKLMVLLQCDKIDHKPSDLTQETAYHIEMQFYTKTCDSASKGQKNENSWNCTFNTHKPDIDNYAKFYLDVLNEIYWCDDSQIISLSAKKYFSKCPRTVIKIFEYPKINMTPAVKKFISTIDPQDLRQFITDCSQIAKIQPEWISRMEQDVPLSELETYNSWLEMVSSMMIDFANLHKDKITKLAKHAK